jgi:hypothetical protein
MNFHTRTILDILSLDTTTRSTIAEIIRSERKLWKKTHKKKRGGKYAVSEDKLEKLDTAMFSLSIKPAIKSELNMYLTAYGTKFLNSIGMLWLVKDIDVEKIDYAKLIAEIIEL